MKRTGVYIGPSSGPLAEKFCLNDFSGKSADGEWRMGNDRQSPRTMCTRRLDMINLDEANAPSYAQISKRHCDRICFHSHTGASLSSIKELSPIATSSPSTETAVISNSNLKLATFGIDNSSNRLKNEQSYHKSASILQQRLQSPAHHLPKTNPYFGGSTQSTQTSDNNNNASSNTKNDNNDFNYYILECPSSIHALSQENDELSSSYHSDIRMEDNISIQKAAVRKYGSRGELHIMVTMRRNLMTIYINRGRNFFGGSISPCNSYVRLVFTPDDHQERTHCRTALVPHSDKPIFDQKFSIALLPEDQYRHLLVSVWNRDLTVRGRSQLLGCMTFTVNRLTHSNKVNILTYYGSVDSGLQFSNNSLQRESTESFTRQRSRTAFVPRKIGHYSWQTESSDTTSESMEDWKRTLMTSTTTSTTTGQSTQSGVDTATTTPYENRRTPIRRVSSLSEIDQLAVSEQVVRRISEKDIQQCLKNKPGLTKPFTKKLSFLRRKTDWTLVPKSKPTKESLLAWATSFDNLLNDQYGCQLFRKFLQQEFSDENIDFWIACKEYRQMIDPKKMAIRAKEIYATFIAVNLDSNTRCVTQLGVEKADKETFDMAQYRIEHLMEKDSYQRFIKCQLYTDLLMNIKK